MSKSYWCLSSITSIYSDYLFPTMTINKRQEYNDVPSYFRADVTQFYF